MTVLQFIDSLVGRLAWPIVALLLGLVFRRPISGTLDRLKKVRWGEREAELTELAEKASEVREAVEDISKPLPTDRKESEERNRKRIETLIRQSAEWGFSVGKAGLKKLPDTEICWENGRVTGIVPNSDSWIESLGPVDRLILATMSWGGRRRQDNVG